MEINPENLPPDFPPKPPLVDWLLAMIESTAVQMANKSDGRFETRVMLNVSGLCISGTIIDRTEYLQSCKNLDVIGEALLQSKTEIRDYFFVHLKDVAFEGSCIGQNARATENKKQFWRGRLDRVDGFTVLGTVRV